MRGWSFVTCFHSLYSDQSNLKSDQTSCIELYIVLEKLILKRTTTVRNMRSWRQGKPLWKRCYTYLKFYLWFWTYGKGKRKTHEKSTLHQVLHNDIKLVL